MDEQSDVVIIWKTSRRGMGERHLREGYRPEDFPGRSGGHPDGCAYFAKDRWMAEEFAHPRLTGYEDYLIEIRIPRDVYDESFREFEDGTMIGNRAGVELAVPRQNRVVKSSRSSENCR